MRLEKFPVVVGECWTKKRLAIDFEINHDDKFRRWKTEVFQGFLIDYVINGSDNHRVRTDIKLSGTIVAGTLVSRSESYRDLNLFYRVRAMGKSLGCRQYKRRARRNSNLPF
jgi:hypothetical protein